MTTQQPIDELDRRALTQYLTVLEDIGQVRGVDDQYFVVSQSGRQYLVDVDLDRCECADCRYRDRRCKHLRRVDFATGRRPIPSWIDRQALDESLGEHVDSGPYFDAREVGE